MKELLRFLACGSVDDGKSTLIGRLLYDAKTIFSDQKDALLRDSKHGANDGQIDYSLLLDGLTAEREQGITIDIAYRYFTTEKRSFIVADAPGHEEYTRNMAVGASYSDLALVLIDASLGVLTQTKRHVRICHMMGIRHFVFVVNKMDLVSYSQDVFSEIEKQIRDLLKAFDVDSLEIIPTSATQGDNVTARSDQMPWYQHKALLPYLESVEIDAEEAARPFVMSVQRVCRPNSAFRGYQGEINDGHITVGDAVTVFPSGERAVVTEIYNGSRKVDAADKGAAVTLCLDTALDVSRGCVLSASSRLFVDSCFTAEILWLDGEPLQIGKSYLLKIANQKLPAIVTRIKNKIDINDGSTRPARTLLKNEIAVCEICADKGITLDLFSNSQDLGSLILIDRVTHATCACGVIQSHPSVDRNIFSQRTDLNRNLREQHLSQRALTVWFTGMSGAGKSTIANALEKKLFLGGRATMLLDADNVRQGLNRDLGFAPEDRTENIRRLAETAKLMNDAGLIVLVSAIAPREADRVMARGIIGDAFREVYVSTPLSVCMQRDPKGLYKKALDGKIESFTGVSAQYEPPENPDVVIDTSDETVEACVETLLQALSL